MKKILIYLTTVAVIMGLSFCTNNTKTTNNEFEGQISISGAFALYPMAVKWGQEFKKLHPKVKIDISAGGAGKGMTDVLSKMVDIGMVSREIYQEEIKKGAYGFAVTKDAVVPVISASNPLLKDLLAKGMKKDVGYNIWISGKYTTWGQVFGLKNNTPIHIYTRSDACGAAEIWAKYFGKKQEDINGVGVFGDPGLAQAVKKDPIGIGYNNIAYVYDAKTKKPNPAIVVLPIDLNNNGKIDADENFYNNLDELINAIATGKYPSPPARDLFFVTYGKPQKKVVIEFIKWILTDGQKYVQEAGYINLSKEKIAEELKK